MRFSTGLLRQIVVPIAGCLVLISGLVLSVHALPEGAYQQGNSVLLGCDIIPSLSKEVEPPDLSGPWEPLSGVDWLARSGHTSVALPDGSIILIGGYDSENRFNDVWRSEDQGNTWIELSPHATWSARSGHTSVVLSDGSIVLMGGYDGSHKNDVWRSEDQGATWTEVNSSAEWSGRAGHQSVVLSDNSIILMGGYDGDYHRDVWRSTDQGASWEELTTEAQWSKRGGFSVVALSNNDIVLMFGHGTTSPIKELSDVWLSTDMGETWSEVDVEQDYLGRYDHTTVVLPDDSIILMGGRIGPYISSPYLSSVWQSFDKGKTWIELSRGIWPSRAEHTSMVMPDDSIVLIGGKNTTGQLNDVWLSPDQGSNWIEKAVAEWSAREGHASLVLPDGSILLMGGYDGDNRLNDVWRSMDKGETWVEMTSDAEWSGRSDHASVVLPDGNIVLMGGREYLTKNDVWRSTDQGAKWHLMTEHADWSARDGHTSVVLSDGSILLMGGGSGITNTFNDVWRSDDQGATWQLITENAEWSRRIDHTSVVLPDDSILLMGGGGSKNDVWHSTDEGKSWSQMTGEAEWSERGDHASVVLSDGSIVLFGGVYQLGEIIRLNDLWHSKDKGATWNEITEHTEWSARNSHTSVVLTDGSIVLLGGYAGNGKYKHDVWRLSTGPDVNFIFLPMVLR